MDQPRLLYDWRKKSKKWQDLSMRLHQEIKKGEKINPRNFTGKARRRFKVLKRLKKRLGYKFVHLENLIKAGKSRISYLDYVNILRGKDINIKPRKLRRKLRKDAQLTLPLA